YISYYPDIAVPGAVETVGSFAELAVTSGVPRLVLLSGRGEAEAEHAEQAVRDSGAELTILRSTWFAQNFSEDYLLEHVLSGEVIALLSYLFGKVFDGRNAHLADGVQRALGRAPRDFADYARDAATTGVWDPPPADRVA